MVQVSRLYDRRILEYVAVGDYEMAVGLAMASPPARSLAFYRNSLLTIAAAGATRFQRERAAAAAAAGNAALHTQASASRSTHAALDKKDSSQEEDFAIQALKVVAEHARSIGDTVTGVTLLCSVGRFTEAVAQLQACSDWHRAITLAAHTLDAPARCALLHAWVGLLRKTAPAQQHPWHIASVCAAAGSFRTAAAVIRQAGMPAGALAFANAAARLGATDRVSPSSTTQLKAPAKEESQASQPVVRRVSEAAQSHEASGSVFTEPPSARSDGKSMFEVSPKPQALTGGDLISLADDEQSSAQQVAAGGNGGHRARMSLTERDLLSHAAQSGAAPETPSGSEAAEAGSRSQSVSPVRANVQRPELQSQAGAGAVSSVKDDAEGHDKSVEVLMNLHAPAGVVNVDVWGTDAVNNSSKLRRDKTEHSMQRMQDGSSSMQEVITYEDSLQHMRKAARQQAIEVLSEALASEAWG